MEKYFSFYLKHSQEMYLVIILIHTVGGERDRQTERLQLPSVICQQFLSDRDLTRKGK